MSKKNNQKVSEAKKNAQAKAADKQRTNPIIAKFEKMIKSVDTRIAKLETKKTTGMTEDERKKLTDAFEAKIKLMREKFEARLAKKNGGSKFTEKIDTLKFEKEQYTKALAIFKETPKTEEKK